LEKGKKINFRKTILHSSIMKSLRKLKAPFAFLLFSIILIMLINIIKEQTPLNFVIADWYNDKAAALSIAFDDGTEDQIKLGIPLLKKFNFKASFYLITSKISDWKIWEYTYRLGNEIGSHSHNHFNLKRLDKSAMLDELKISYLNIINNLPDQKCFSIAYPYGKFDENVIKEAKEIYIAGRMSRTSNFFFNKYETFKPYELIAIGLHNKSSLSELSQYVEETIKNKAWLIEVIHGIKDDSSFISTGWKPINAKILQEHFSYIKKREEKLWVAPINHIVLYMLEKKSSKIILEKNNEKEYKLSLKYPKLTCYHPLTLKIWKNKELNLLSIYQNGNTIPFYEKNKYIYFNISLSPKPLIIKLK